MATLFDKTKQKGVTKKAETHEVVILPELENDIQKIVNLKAQIAELEATLTIADSTIREAGKDAMVKLYKEKKRFPGTLKVVAGKGSYQFITSDRYIKIDEERHNELAQQYGPELVEENTVYSFNTEILENHMEHISDLLMSSEILSEREKEDLLNAVTSYTVKKGTIKDLANITDDIEGIITDIQPVFSVKSVQVSE